MADLKQSLGPADPIVPETTQATIAKWMMIITIAIIAAILWSVYVPKEGIESVISKLYGGHDVVLAAPDLPVCTDAKPYLYAGRQDLSDFEVPMRPDCTSGWITPPIAWKNVRFSAPANKGVQIWILGESGSIWLPPDDTRWLPPGRKTFRLRGEGSFLLWDDGSAPADPTPPR